jgi:hypothetical protein
MHSICRYIATALALAVLASCGNAQPRNVGLKAREPVRTAPVSILDRALVSTTRAILDMRSRIGGKCTP